MARKYGSLGALAMMLMMGCSLDGSSMEAHTAPLSLTPGGPGVSFGIATSPGGSREASAATNPSRRAEGALNVAGESNRPMPLQAGANVVTTSPEIIGGFNFGPTPVDTIQQVTWSVTNIGDTATEALILSSTNNIQFSASVAACAPLAPLDSCDVTITYAPGQSLAAHSSTFSVVGFPGSAYIFSGSGRPPFSAENP